MRKRGEFHEQATPNRVIMHSSKANRFQCAACKKTWVGHRHESHFGLRAGIEKIELARELIDLGGSVRTIARVVGVSPTTIHRWKSIL